MTVTIHQVTHNPGGTVRCSCGWTSSHPVFSGQNAQHVAKQHLADKDRRR